MKNMLLALVGLGISSVGLSEIPIERNPNIVELPADYPGTWLFANDANFSGMIAGKIVIVDIAADSHEYKGAIGSSMMATFIESTAYDELYVAETFYSRGTVGERTDVVTIYDKRTLNRTGEILLPNKNRGQFVTNRYAMQLVDQDRYLLVLNFTPASSVSVIDTKSKRLLNEIPLPGCSLIYPTGPRGFASLCGDGSMVAIQFDKKGEQISKHLVESFFSVDDDPIFDKPAYIGDTAYFVSYKGLVYAVDMSAAEPKPMPPWSLVTAEEREANWRPAGWQVISGDDAHGLYVIMQSNGFDGSHKSGGEQVWIADAESKQVVRKNQMNVPAFSLEFVQGDEGMLAVTNINMWLDVYTADGEHLRSLTLGDAAMPFVLHRKR